MGLRAWTMRRWSRQWFCGLLPRRPRRLMEMRLIRSRDKRLKSQGCLFEVQLIYLIGKVSIQKEHSMQCLFNDIYSDVLGSDKCILCFDCPKNVNRKTICTSSAYGRGLYSSNKLNCFPPNIFGMNILPQFRYYHTLEIMMFLETKKVSDALKSQIKSFHC